MALTLPGVSITVQDYALGIINQSGADTEVLCGVCSQGTVNSIQSFASLTSLQQSLGAGPLVEAAANALNVSGGPVYVMPLNPSVAGAASVVTHTGTGTGTVGVLFAPPVSVVFTVTTGGALGTAQATCAIGTATASAPFVLPVGGTYQIPGLPLTTVTFPAGTYIVADTYTLNLDGSVSHTGTGPASVTQASSPVDQYQNIITVSTAGALGTAAITVSTDNGTDTSLPVVTPADGYYQIPGTGVVLQMSGSFTKSDTYSFFTVPAFYGSSDITSAGAVLQANPALTYGYFLLQFVGTPASAAAAESMASELDSLCAGLVAKFKYIRSMMEAPTLGSIVLSGGAAIADTADTDAVLETAFASFASDYVAVAAGDEDLKSPISGNTFRRNAAWPIAARLSQYTAGIDGAKVANGSVTGVSKLYRDEAATPGLDASRFCTLRTFLGLPGFYVTNVKTMATADSDYSRMAHARVMDKACLIAYAAAILYVNSNVTAKADETISERSAQRIEAQITNKLRSGLVPQDCTDSVAAVDRTNNIVSTSQLNVTVRVKPFGYTEYISVNIGFSLS